MDEDNSKLPRLIGSIPMLAVGMSSLCYILGLLITNLHLASFGIYSVEFLRGEYLLTGAVLIFLVAVTWSFLRYAIITTKVKYLLDQRSSKKWYLAFRIAYLISIFFYLEISVFKPLTNAQFSPNNMEWWGGVGVLILFAGVLELLIRELSSYLRVWKVQDVSDSLELSKLAMGTNLVAFLNKSPLVLPMILLSLLLSFLQFYTQLLYPHMQGAYGGGTRNLIYVVPTPRGVEISKIFSLPSNKDKTLIGPLEVLTESDKEIVVLISSELSPKKKIAMRLNKDSFDAVQSQPLNK